MNSILSVKLLFTGLISLILILLAAFRILMVRFKRSDKQKTIIEARYNELELIVNNLQLETLGSRLNPHLFKNVLNSIQSHAYQTYYASISLPMYWTIFFMKVAGNS